MSEGNRYWPQFGGESLYESLINHYAFNIEEQQEFEYWLFARGIHKPEEMTDAQALFHLFQEWAWETEEWVGAFSQYRKRGGGDAMT